MGATEILREGEHAKVHTETLQAGFVNQMRESNAVLIFCFFLKQLLQHLTFLYLAEYDFKDV